MSQQFFSIFRAVLTAFVTAVASFIISYLDRFGEPDYSDNYEYQ